MSVPYGITFNSVDFGALGLLIDSRYNLSPTVTAGEIVPAARDGTIKGDTRYRRRLFRIRGTVQGTSLSDLQATLDLIAAELVPRTDQRLDLSRWTDRFWLARLKGELEVDERGTAATLVFQLEAADPPFGLSIVENIAFSETVTTNPQTFVTVTVGGTVYTEPVWIYTAAGTVTAVTLENITEGTLVSWTDPSPLSSGDLLRFDTAAKKVEKSTDAGVTFVSAMSGVAVGASWPHLAPRLANSIRISGVTAGTLAATYRDRFF